MHISAHKTNIISAIVMGSALVTGNVYANDTNDQKTPQSDIKITIGAGGMMQSEYEGSDEYEFSFLPVAKVKWKDRVTLSVAKGLELDVVKTPNVAFGVGLGYWMGRDEEDSDALTGLGDMEANTTGRLYGHYDFGAFRAGASLDADIGGDREGVSFELSTKYRSALSKKMSFSMGPSITEMPSKKWSSTKC